MDICTVCNNDSFVYHDSEYGALAICDVCGEESYFEEDDEYEEVLENESCYCCIY